MQRLEDFRIFYNHTIHPELLRLERKRKRLLWLLFFSFFFLAGVWIFQILIHIPVVSLMLMIPIGLYITYLVYRIQQFVRTFKPQVVNLILDFIDDGVNYGTLSYEPKGFIPKKVFQTSGIFLTNADTYLGEDLIRGSIGEHKFELCELNVREFSKVRSRLNHVFRGVFLHSNLRSSINGSVLILPREFRQYLSRTIRAITNKRARNIDGMIKSQPFREEYLTFATQDAQTKDLLSEGMLDALVSYTRQTTKDLYISFINKKIYIAITEQKDILEPYIFRSNVSFELVREFFEDISLLMRVVQDFDANH